MPSGHRYGGVLAELPFVGSGRTQASLLLSLNDGHVPTRALRGGTGFSVDNKVLTSGLCSISCVLCCTSVVRQSIRVGLDTDSPVSTALIIRSCCPMVVCDVLQGFGMYGWIASTETAITTACGNMTNGEVPQCRPRSHGNESSIRPASATHVPIQLTASPSPLPLSWTASCCTNHVLVGWSSCSEIRGTLSCRSIG